MIEHIQHSNAVVELRIARPPANAMDLTTLRWLRGALAEAKENRSAGILLTSTPSIFSSGIDVLALLQGNDAAVYDYWREVFYLAADMARSAIPIVSAISGHCLGAGTLLALFTDYRLMAEGPWQIGFNEVCAGVSLPDCFQLALRRTVGSLQAERMLVHGTMLTPAQAQSVRLVDELVPADQLIECSRSKLEQLLALPRHSMLAMRSIARQDLANAFQDVEALPITSFVNAFLSKDTQTVLRYIAASIERRAQHA